MKLKKYFLETCSIYLLLLGLWCITPLTTQAQDITLTTQRGVDTIRNMLGESTVVGDLTIGNSTDITHLDSLYFLTKITGNLEISNNSMLEDVGDFPALDSIRGNFFMHTNAILRNAGDFPVLKHIGGYFLIRASDSLTSVGFFPRLATVGGYFAVRGTKILRVLYEFPSLTSIGTGNPYVPSVDALAGMNGFPGNTSIVVEDNPLLEYCCVLTRLRAGGGLTISGSRYVNNNFEGCSSIAMSSCNLSVRLSVGDTVRSPFFSEETAFTLYSNARWQLSRLNPGDADWVTSLSSGGVSNSDSLISERDARIMVNYSPNTSGESRTVRLLISFLDEMDVATPADTLTLIQGLEESTLQSASAVNVSHVLGRTEINIFSNVRWRLHKSEEVDWLTILSSGTTNVTDSLEGGQSSVILPEVSVVTLMHEAVPTSSSRSSDLILSAIDSNGTKLSIPPSITITVTQLGIPPPYTNDVILTNQAEVDDIRTTLGRSIVIDANLIIEESSANTITDLSPLNFLTEITGNLAIRNNSMLEDVGEFPALDSIGGNFLIHSNAILRNAGNFPMLSGIGGYFLIRASASLTSVGSFPRLTTIGESFSVRGATILRVLYDFPALTSIGMGSAWVPSVSSGTMKSVDNVSIVVEDNPLLFYCCGLSRFFSGRSNAALGSVHITNNSTSCNSEEEISCDISSRLTSDTFMLPFYTTDTTFIFHSPTRWRLSQEGTAADWITGLSLDGGSTNVTNNLMGDQTASITVTYAQNGTAESRTVRLLISFLDTMGNVLTSPMPYTLTLIQEEVMPTLQLPPDTVNVSHFSGSTDITLSANNVKWRLRKPDTGADWITMLSVGTTSHTDALTVTNNSFFSTDTVVTITYDKLPISLADRSTSLVLEAIDNDGGVLDDLSPITITLTQAIAPYMGDITLTTQAEVDTILNTLGNPRVTAIVGNLIIGPSTDINNLDSLYFLTKITGNFEIGQEGSNTEGVPNDNSALVDIGDFPFLQKIGGSYYVTQNTNLVNGGNFPVLDSIGGYFFIRANAKLENVGTFPRLKDIGTYFSIRSSDSLRSLYEFPALTSIGKGSPYVPSNGSETVNTSIVVEQNPLLFYCCGLSRFFSGRSNPASGRVYIGSNSTGCDSEEEISCDIFDQPLTDTLRLPFHTTDTTADTTFIIHSQTRWRLSREEGTESNWITGLSLDGGSTNVTDGLMGDQTASITVTYAQNGTAESRTARLRISFLDTMDGGELTSPMPYTLTLIQEEVMPTLQLSPDTVNVSDLSGNTNITLTTNNVKWRLRKDSVADWITMLSVGATNHTDTLIVNNNSFDPTDTVVTITYEELPISLTNRRALLVLESIDDEGNILENVSPITITFTQMVPFHPESITLTTQAQVDTIRNTLGNPRITVIDGNLIIRASSDITNLDSLYFLTEITGDFFIGNTSNGNDSLKDIGGFPFLQKIGGNYYVTENPELVNGGNFPVLDSIGGYFFIRSNAKLESVGSFPRLKDIGTYVSIRSNGNLRSLYDFPALTSIGMGSAWVPSSNSGNGSTVSGVSIVVEDNPLLFYCCTLTKFRSGGSNPVSGTIYINNNSTGCSSAGQANCDPFLRLSMDRDTVASSSLETSFILTANTRWRLSKLNSETNWITSFSAENMTERDSLTGGQNDSLLTSTSVTINYNQNFISEDSLTERLLVSLLDETGEALTSPAPDTFMIVRHMIVRQRNQLYIGDITVTTQEQVNALGVSGGALEGNITKIMGNVTISRSVTDLRIFNNIDTITGYLKVEGLTQLDVLNKETSPGSGNYTGFANLKMIGDYFLVGDSSSSTNSSLDSVGYFPHLDSVGGYFQIRNNASLDAMGSFPVLRSIGADFSVQDNDQLLHIPDFDSLIRVGQNFGILSHDTLATIGSFPKLKTIGGYYQISSNDSLVNVGDFPVLQAIGGTFYVTNNDTLTTLGNFPQLMSIGTNDSVNIPSEGRNISDVSVVIESNTNLSNCQTLTEFLRDGAVSGEIFINNNALGCSSGDEIKASAPHTIMLTSHTDGDSIAVAYDVVAAQTIMFSIGGGATGWTSAITGDDFITLDTDMNVAQDTGVVITVTATPTENTGVERSATIRITTTGGTGAASTFTVTITQAAAPPMLTLTSPSTVTLAHDVVVEQTITFTVGGSASGWTSSMNGDNFITLTDDGNETGAVVVTAALSGANTGVERSAMITFTTEGGTGDAATAMVTIRQAAAPPTLMVSTFEDTMINHDATEALSILFELGGTAVGWEAEVIGDDDFITLAPVGPNTSATKETVTIMATASANTGVERKDTIVFTTGDVSDTVVITQSAGPPIFTLTSDSADAVAYDAETASDITFNVGGGATGWWAGVIDRDDDTNDFVTLSEISGSAGLDTIEVTTTVNTGVARVDTVVVGTGGEGEATDTIIVTQEAVPTISLTDPVDGTISTDYNEVTETITFEVGGSATDWTASSDQSFVTLDITSGASGMGLMATVTENRDVQRTATITITTTGQLGAAKTATVMITQRGASGSPALEITTPSGDTTVAYTATTTSDSVEIMFTTTNAMGWESMISYGVGVGEFVTLSDTVNADQTDTVKIKVAVTENVGVERSAKIVFSTTGQGSFSSAKDSLTITQGGAPPTFMLTSDSAETIAYGAETASDITFNVGGGATGWWAGVIDGDSDNNFVTLSKPSGSAGLDTIKVTTTVNTGEARVDTVVITTVEGKGVLKDTVIVTQQEAPPTIVVSTNNTTINHDVTGSLSISFTLGGTAVGWDSRVTGAGFITLDSSMSTTATKETVTITAMYGENTGVERKDTVVFTTTGGVSDTVVITQSAGPPIFTLTSDSAETIAYGAETASGITFEVGGGATGWLAVVIDSDSDNNFVMLDKTSGSAGLDTIKVTTLNENMGLSRMDTVVITTVEGTGVLKDTVIVTQAGAPPMLDVSIPTLQEGSNDTTIAYNAMTDIDIITFEVGGGATGWWATVIDGDGNDFLSLSLSSVSPDTIQDVAGTATISVTSRENSGKARMDTIVITTVGGFGDPLKDTIVITQSAGPPIFTLTSGDADTTAYGIDTLDIIFEVGGGASGWDAEVIDRDDNTNNFLTLVKTFGSAGSDTIKVAVSKNTGLSRIDTIKITTDGGTGDAKDTTVTITQSAAPPTLLLTSDATVTLAHDVDAAQTIAFTVGGGASGWTSSMSGDNFITLSDDGATTGDVVVTATPSANTGVERSTMITFTTMGGTGDAKDTTVMITQEAAPPTLLLTSPSTVTLAHDVDVAQTITFTVGGGASGWTSSMSGETFITLSEDGTMTGDVTVTATPSANTGVERSVMITFMTDGGTGVAKDTTVMITQSAAPPSLVLTSSSTVTLPHDVVAEQTITFTVGGSASGWTSAITGDDFITLADDDGTVTGDVVVTATPSNANTGDAARSAVITFTTSGGVGDSATSVVTITQSAAPPSLVLTSSSTVTLAHDVVAEQTIMFTVGGSASGWTSAITGDNFITLADDGATTGDVVVTATPSANTGVERSVMITFTTDGGTGAAKDTTVTITQSAAPPSLVLTSPSTVTLAHDVDVAQTITFTVGGSASGWTSAITGDNFITLADDGATTGDVVVTATPSANTGVERSVMITFMTDGGTGAAKDTTVTITQSAAPPSLVLTSSSTVTLAHDVVAEQTIMFTVGGSASGWTSAITGDNFITLADDGATTGDVVVTATPSANTGVERSVMITFTTDGGTGAAKDTTVTITQSAAPPSLVLTSPSTVTLAHDVDVAQTITFTVGGSASGWTSAITGDNFITLADDGATTGDVVVTATPSANTGVERSVMITFMTDGGTGAAKDTTVTITQSAAPPSLVLTSSSTVTLAHDVVAEQTIMFTVGGSASGWTSAITGDNFITLADDGATTGDVVVTATPSANAGVERSAVITFTTMGGTGVAEDITVMITQSAAPPSLVLTSPSTVTLAHDVDVAQTIRFTVGGGASGWTSSMSGDDFITLADDGATTGDVVVTATPSNVNGGDTARSAVITFTTAGGTGTAATATVMITQGVAGAPTLLLTSSFMVTLAHDVVAGQMITFTVGDATGWTSEITGDDFITLTDDGAMEGDVVVTATPSGANTGVERSAMITFTTMGGTGDAATAVVTITQSAAPPMFTLTSGDAETIAHSAESASNITFTVGGGATGWTSSIAYTPELALGASGFITLTPDNGERGDVVVTVVSTMNTMSVERSAVITFTTMGGTGDAATSVVTLTQSAPVVTPDPVTLMVSTFEDTTINDESGSLSISFTLGGTAKGWTSAVKGADFITLTPSESTSDTNTAVTVVAAYEANTGVERTDTIVFTTTGGVTDMITITQAAAPPTLMVSTFEDTTINDEEGSLDITFTLGGTAKGWTSAVKGADFITLTPSESTSDTNTAVTVVAAYGANIGVERTDTIVFTTGDVADTVVITQSAGPPIFTLTSGDAETIAHDAEAASDIIFNVGGGATGWWAGVIDGDSSNNFVMLDKTSGSAGLDTIKVTTTVNTGEARVDTVVVGTGGEGEATDTIIITQEAIPTISLTDPVDGMIVIDYNAVTDTAITFDVGGSATDWTASSDQSFVTLDITSGASGTGLMATVTENMDVLRVARITITTEGQLGAAKTATVMITQTGDPDAPALEITTPSGDATVAYTATTTTTTSDSVEIMFTTANAIGWESMIFYGDGVDEFVTLSPMDSVAQTDTVKIKVAVTENAGVERSAKIVFSTTGTTGGGSFSSAKDSLTITQGGAPPTLTKSRDTTIAYDVTATDTLNIGFTVGGGAESWTVDVIDGDDANDFLTLVSTSGDAGAGTVRAIPTANTGGERMDTLVITTVGGTGVLTDTIIVTQQAGPPTLVVSTDDTTINHDATGAFEISFTLGGSAMGWSSTLTGDNFITLTPEQDTTATGEVTIMATATVNDTGAERKDTITFTTGNISDTVVITQEALIVTPVPATLMVSTFEDTTVSDAVGSLSISFTLGGTAKGWTSEVKGDGFITLTLSESPSDTNTAVTIMAAYGANAGVERKDTIIFTTTTGGVASDTVVITQRAAPPAAPRVSITTADQTIVATSTETIDVVFTVGGSALGWESRVTGGFITLDTAMNADQTGEITIQATPTVNTGAERVAKIVIIPTGGTGTAVSGTITITQSAAETLGISLEESLTLYPNPTDGVFFVEGLSGALEVHVHDLLGRQVATHSLSAGERKVDISALSSGMYVVTLKESGGELLTRVLIKQ